MPQPTAPANSRAGRWEQQRSGPEPFYCFIPAPLPPDPPLDYDAELHDLQERANRALGRLDGIAALLPNPDLFLYTYVRKEAVLSSQIEGTQSSLSDLLLFENEEAPGVPDADVREVSNYVAAMQHGLNRLRGGFPLSIRLLKEIHARLLKGSRGADKEPGEIRRSQNWVGGTRPGNALYVPPPPHEVLACLGALEKFLHDDPVKMPVLIKAGLAHAQFESIHPFLDGNGRLGRLLITFIFCAEGALVHPLLYLSLYFKQHRAAYYDLLQRVRTHGEWERWLKFYLAGIEEVSTGAADTAKKLLALFDRHRQQIQQLGKAASSALRVHDLLRERVVLSLAVAAKELNVSFPTVNKAMLNLEKLGFVKEFTGRQRNRLFSYEPYLKILRQGTEPMDGSR
ncbi:MAG: Fic family protein [Verrucomicrobia bacterium]|nr:Fic family protein [Verrucomicrobiota bacterium]